MQIIKNDNADLTGLDGHTIFKNTELLIVIVPRITLKTDV